MKENPRDPQKVVCIIQAKSRDEADGAIPKILHYGKYSALTFDKGRNISKKTVGSERGIEMKLREDSPAVDLSALKSLSTVIEGAREATAASRPPLPVTSTRSCFSSWRSPPEPRACS